MILPSNAEIQREEHTQALKIHGGWSGHLFAKTSILCSRLWLPTKSLRLLLLRDMFARKFPPGIDETEADRLLQDYPSLNAMFTRGLKPECRPIAPTGVICPCDGTIQDLGQVQAGQILTLKGIPYSIASLLPNLTAQSFEGWHYCITFLAPRDCHRVFSPQTGQLKTITHVPGARLVLHPSYQTAKFPVYTFNERVIFEFSTANGPCILVMVAGYGVGNITLPKISDFKPQGRSLTQKILATPLSVDRGEWFATFELGSSVILLLPPQTGSQFAVSPQDSVKYGQPVFR